MSSYTRLYWMLNKYYHFAMELLEVLAIQTRILPEAWSFFSPADFFMHLWSKAVKFLNQIRLKFKSLKSSSSLITLRSAEAG